MTALDLLTRLPLVVIAIAAVVGVVLALWRRERYQPPTDLRWTLPTTEVFVDPESRRRLRVYVNPVTGERAYQEDLTPPEMLPPLHGRPGIASLPPPPALPPPPPPPDAAAAGGG